MQRGGPGSEHGLCEASRGQRPAAHLPTHPLRPRHLGRWALQFRRQRWGPPPTVGRASWSGSDPTRPTHLSLRGIARPGTSVSVQRCQSVCFWKLDGGGYALR